MPELREQLVSALAGRYDVERELGHGGMAHVFLARDLKHDRHVAIKVLKPQLAATLGAERFLREINITARLSHPNILTLHDSGAIDDRLLYYVMPYVADATLRQRLDREKQLPIDEAVSIVRQTAAALDYAHRENVVHRDIKPANILLAGDHVLVADFGLARMFYTAESTPLSYSSVVVGTPAYMSPEQIAGDAELDGRTDIYSLACVFFEMLAGMPPFHGVTQQALYGQHLKATPPSLCAERENCPEEMDAAVRRALSKVPADRFRTATEFVHALVGETHSTSGARGASHVGGASSSRRRRWVRVGGASLAVTALAAAAMIVIRHEDPMAAASLDSSAYVVLPLDAAGSGIDTAAVTERLIDALGEWNGVRIVDGRSTSEQVIAAGENRLRLTDASRIARDKGAANVVWGEVAREGDSVVVRASLYDATTSNLHRSHTVSFGAANRLPRSKFRELAIALLRDRSESPWTGEEERTRQSLAAWLAYDAGREATARWDIRSAEARFRDALAADADHARAHLWLARLLIWNGQPREAWRADAKRALELRDQLSERDVLAAEAQVALADARYPTACEKYARMVALDTSEFSGWFGLGECVVRDSVVLADRTSASGFSFRSSWQRAVNAYLHIIDDMPAPHPEFVYARLQRVLYTESNKMRVGRGVSGMPTFYAYASRDGDTLAFVPYPSIGKASSQRSATPHSLLDAMEQNRKILRAAFAAWVRDAPRSLNVRVALAGLLESAGEISSTAPDRPSAVSEIRVARSLATDSAQRIALVAAEIRLHLKNGEWMVATRQIDSLFRAPRPAGASSKALIGLAALSGRVRIAAELFLVEAKEFDVALPAGGQGALSPELRSELARMRAYASLGICDDRSREFTTQVDRLLESTYNEPRLRATARDALLRRPLSLLAPCQGVRPLVGIADGGDRIVAMQQALARGDRPAMRTQLNSLRAGRASSRPGDVAIDYTYLEAWLLTQMGDTSAAVRQLDRSLDALPTLGTSLVDLPSQAGGLVRAMVLRADLANALGDKPNATRWANAVGALWVHADPELQPVVTRMRSIGGSSH